ncbi:hypothetical protein [Neorhizobium sp. T7_12]|uniref:hypothetical protein n=1 Tax=Neorhizobium sp. T7_12 TaxID=2093832 RepID=UPI00155ED518|nr:hypothetical protein [Neorhizobium sp. T7_12]
MSGRFAGVGEILTELAVAVINFEGRSLELNNPITVDELDLWRFPSHISFLLRISKAAARARRHTTAFFVPESPGRLAPAHVYQELGKRHHHRGTPIRSKRFRYEKHDDRRKPEEHCRFIAL